ncbi:condensin complex subunit 3 isoform X2 [Anabrus simplex]|uniref:condensin complex subunit 3 isoform X2 n=1 Tax=Anabrus simplex TaxID=316456 RepID=UPI0034DD20DA
MTYATVEEIFQKAQINVAYHAKLIPQLTRLYEKAEHEAFLKTFIRCLQVALIHGEKHPSVERVVDFAAKFSVSLNKSSNNNTDDSLNEEDEEMCPFLLALFYFLFKNHQCNNQSIRFRVCQFINKILQNLGEEAFIDDELCNQISECMMERLQDKSPAVRSQAVMALLRLQDPTNPNCPVIKAYIYHLRNDPSPEVRRAVLTCLGRSHLTVPHIRERTRDVKDTVRKQAYSAISKLNIRSFTIHNRELLLRDGLRDRSEIVRTFVEKVLLSAWLDNLDGDYFQFLHALDVENSTETSLLALNAFFKHKPIKEVTSKLVLQDKLLPMEALTSETAFYWRCLAQYLHSHDETDDLDEIIPELTPFCEYIRQYMARLKSAGKADDYDRIQHEFVVLQLLELAKVFDLADEVGRGNLRQLLLDLLMNKEVKKKLVPVIVELLVEVIPDVNTRLQTLAEVISEIHEPLSEVITQITQEERQHREFKKAQIRAERLELQEELEQAVGQKDFLRAQEIDSQLNELAEKYQQLTDKPEVITQEVRKIRDDPLTLSKCLCIVYEMMQSPTISCMTPHLRSLMEDFVTNNLKVEDALVQVMALQTMGVFCLLEKELAQKHILMFYYYLGNNSVDEVCIVALKAIFDMLLLYGLQTFAIEEEMNDEAKRKRRLLHDDTDVFEEKSNDSVANESLQDSSSSSLNLLSILTTLLDNTTGLVRSTAVEGFCKLFLASRITSPVLLSRLIILWYNPVTEDDTYLRQVLSQFFTIYATNCPSSQEILEQAFLPTLHTFLFAPYASPLVNVDPESVGKFLLGLTRPGINSHTTQINVHNNLAVTLCNEILREPDGLQIKDLLKILSHVELTVDDTQRQTLRTLSESMAKEINDKIFLRYISKFQQNLDMNTDSTLRTSDADDTQLANSTAAISLNPRNSAPSLTNNEDISVSSPADMDDVFDSPSSNVARAGSTATVSPKRSVLSTAANFGSDRGSLQSVSISSVDSVSPPRTRRKGKAAARE